MRMLQNSDAEKKVIRRIAVFCGSSRGTERIFEEQAYELGKTLAVQNIELVYGGAKVEIANLNLTELVMVDTMHQRKAKMNELSDGVIALPGGFGTLEEFFEMLTWAQLGLHRKPVALLNVDGFYDVLLALVDTMVDRGFLRKENKEMLLVSDNIEDLLDKMRKYEAPSVGKWLNRAGLLNK